jgi:Arc/MetJ-type ribon-helix-helix transcriptional regulator
MSTSSRDFLIQWGNAIQPILDGRYTPEYISSMKVKTSITLSEDLLESIDKWSSRFKNRSDFIEAAVRAYIAHIIREEADARDLAILNKDADSPGAFSCPPITERSSTF